MSVFASAPEFIERDNRTRRTYNPVSAEQMEAKHEALLPESLVSGKSILDIGCGIAATGHWVLSRGATAYIGVEPQAEYASTAELLLEKYHPKRSRIYTQSAQEYFSKDNEPADIVCLFGVLHAFTNPLSLLNAIAPHAKQSIVIEELYANHISPNFCGLEFAESEGMNLATQDASLIGRGVRISPKGLAFMLAEVGFVAEEPFKVGMRYGMRAHRTSYEIPRSLADEIGGTQRGPLRHWI